MNGYLEVKDWTRFQHYKDRTPPWIKLHVALLDNYEFHNLPDASKAHLVGIWILASKLGNKVPADPAWVATRIGATEPVDLDRLVASGFLQHMNGASNSPRLQTKSAMPEVEKETEGETDTVSNETGDAAESHDRRLTEHTLRSCIGLVVELLYFGNRPPEAAMRIEGSIAKQLGEAYGYDRLARAIEGLNRRRAEGTLGNVGPRQAMSLKWLNSKKFDINQLAASEDAFYASAPEPRRGRGKATDLASIVGNIGRPA